MSPGIIKLPLKCPLASVLINGHEVLTIFNPQANLEKILCQNSENFYDFFGSFGSEFLVRSLNIEIGRLFTRIITKEQSKSVLIVSGLIPFL